MEVKTERPGTFDVERTYAPLPYPPGGPLSPPSPTPSLHGRVAGPHPCPADLQPGQLGTVLEELLDGNVSDVQLGGQGVLLLHSDAQLLKDFYRRAVEDRKDEGRVGVICFVWKLLELQ